MLTLSFDLEEFTIICSSLQRFGLYLVKTINRIDMSLNVLMEIHKGMVYLVLLSLTVKIGLMFFKPELFHVVRAKTRVLEMILGPSLLISGLMVWDAYNGFSIQNWILLKIVFMLLAIALAIVGLKKANKTLAVSSLFIFIGLFTYMTQIHH